MIAATVRELGIRAAVATSATATWAPNGYAISVLNRSSIRSGPWPSPLRRARRRQTTPPPVQGTYTADLLPGLLTMPLGAGAVFVGVTIAANDGVPADQAGLAAGLLTAARQIGSALGLAIFSAVATTRTERLLAAHAPKAAALTRGYQRALLVSSIFVLASAIIALRSGHIRKTAAAPETAPSPAIPASWPCLAPCPESR